MRAKLYILISIFIIYIFAGILLPRFSFSATEDCQDDYIFELHAAADNYRAFIFALASDLEAITAKLNEKHGEINILNNQLRENKERLAKMGVDRIANQSEYQLLGDNILKSRREIAEAEVRVEELQKRLLVDDRAEITAVPSPLIEIPSGISISFDLGRTWIRSIGFIGFDKLLQIFHKDRGTGRFLKNENKIIRRVKRQIKRLDRKYRFLGRELGALNDQIMSQKKKIEQNEKVLAEENAALDLIKEQRQTARSVLSRAEDALTLAEERIQFCGN